MSFAFWAIYNCCWNMFIRRTIYWIVIPCAKLQKIFGITIKLGNNFWGLMGFEIVWLGFERRFDGVWDGLKLVWLGLWGCWLTKTEKTSFGCERLSASCCYEWFCLLVSELTIRQIHSYQHPPGSHTQRTINRRYAQKQFCAQAK